MIFYDREEELALLGEMLRGSAGEARMTVVTGRRRVGKTDLCLRCGGALPLLYFFVARKSEAMLCRDFIEEAESKLGVPIGNYQRFGALFRHLMLLAKERPFTLVIDEFQDWTRVNPSVFGEMQREWDLHKRESHINLIVSGSIYSLMHKIFEDRKEPLFSRANRIINVKPFGTGVLKEILSDHNAGYTPADLLTLFGITGGVAWYVELLMTQGKTTSQKMVNMLTEDNSPFINEGKNLLVEEFGPDYGIYFSILSCIAGGMHTRAEIEAATGVGEIGGYIGRLTAHYNLIEKHIPIFAREKTKNVRYAIVDNFLTLWFRFFYKYQHIIETGSLSQLRRIISRDMPTVEGKMLERYFIRKLRESGAYTRVGQYWDRKGENEIDIVAVNEIDRRVSVFEVKRQRSRYDEAALRRKVDAMEAACHALGGMRVETGCLCLEDC